MTFSWGEYPPEYNARVHGTYDPARWYGKPDTALGQVKLGELGSWLGRRNKGPVAITRAMSRGYWRWLHSYMFPVRSGVSGFMQIVTGSMLVMYIFNYKRISGHRSMKYHW